MALYIIFGLVLLALIVLVVVWFYLKKKKAKAAAAAEAEAADSGGAGTEEVDSLVREADRRLAASKQSDRLVNRSSCFLAGDTGSTKTSIMVNAGLEPELLAGLVYRDNNLVPTRTANLWFSRRTIFVEAGGRLPSEPDKWARLIRKLQPRAGVTSQKGQAPRAVLVCYDSENFTRAGAQESATSASRDLRARLGEM
jgi:type VI secretion system protein ImpL